MKFQVTFKTPDAVNDAIERELAHTVIGSSASDREGVGDDESLQNDLREDMRESMKYLASKFVTYGEYVTIEFDTETTSATVVPVR